MNAYAQIESVFIRVHLWLKEKSWPPSLRSARINPGGAFLPAFDPARPELSY